MYEILQWCFPSLNLLAAANSPVPWDRFLSEDSRRKGFVVLSQPPSALLANSNTTLPDINITLRTLCWDVPHACCSVLMSKLKTKSNVFSWTSSKGKSGWWCHNEIILIPIGQCFFIFGWIDSNKFFDLLMNQGFSSCLLICFVIFSFLAHFTL